ncbi:MAG: hypothetical protein ACI9KE_005439 [Polyangiales bacterium]|jgi:hypothetical protein
MTALVTLGLDGMPDQESTRDPEWTVVLGPMSLARTRVPEKTPVHQASGLFAPILAQA